MRNYKMENQLTGPENWPRFSTVFVSGQKDATPLPEGATEVEKEHVIQSWENVAVLRATAKQPTSLFLGFYNQGIISYLNHEFTTDIELGMRIGPDDINFFVFSKDLSVSLDLELVECTTVDDPKHRDLILI